MPLPLTFLPRRRPDARERADRKRPPLHHIATTVFELVVGAVVGSDMAPFVRPWLACSASFLRNRTITPWRSVA